MKFVVDASTTIAWIASDENDPYAEAALDAAGSDAALVPALWQWEIANVLMTLERRRRVRDAGEALAAILRRLPVEVAGNDIADRRIDIDLARRHRLSVYDATYLALAKREQLPLVTLDHSLRKAADAEGVAFRADNREAP